MGETERENKAIRSARRRFRRPLCNIKKG